MSLALLVRKAVREIRRRSGPAAAAWSDEQLARLLAETCRTRTTPPEPAPTPAPPPTPPAPSRKRRRIRSRKTPDVPLPDVRQEKPWACGPGALRCVASALGGWPGTEEDAIALVGATEKDGTPPAGMVRGAAALGLAPMSGTMALRDLAREVASGFPVVCAVQSGADPDSESQGHYVVVCGVDKREIRFHDPAAGPRSLPLKTWLDRWHDRDTAGTVYFRWGMACRPPTWRPNDPARAAKDSYFSHCPRDEHGHCDESGNAPVAPGEPIKDRLAKDKESARLVNAALAATESLHQSAQAAHAKATAQNAKCEALLKEFKGAPPADIAGDKGKVAEWRAGKKAEYNAASKQYGQDYGEVLKTRSAANKAALEALKAPKPTPVDIHNAGGYSDNGHGVAKKAGEWVGSLVHDAGDHWGKVTMARSPEGRAFAVDGPTPTVHLSATPTDDQSVHELGHTLEFKVPGVRDACQAFLAHRCGDEKPQPIVGGKPGQYGANEVGRKDDFAKAFPSPGGTRTMYVGKVYKDGNTEVVSMGLEELHKNAAQFIRNDPEYARFLVGVLHGRLR